METTDQSETQVSLSTRPPFKNLPSDSPMANKKRKSHASPDCRSAKLPKINSKENEDEIQVIEENCTDGEGKNSTSKSDSKNKNSTPNKGKNKKSDKPQTNLLTKFLKKADVKAEEEKNQPSVPEPEEKNSVKNGPNKIIVEVDVERIQGKKSNMPDVEVEVERIQDEKTKMQNAKVVLEKLSNEEIAENNEEKCKKIKNKKDQNSLDQKKISENSMDAESENSSKSNGDTKPAKEDMDVDLEEDSISEDSSKLSDSQDNLNKSHGSTPKIKLNSETPGRKITPKQLEKKLESQKKREAREKERLEREKKRQEEQEKKLKEKEDKKREREEKEKLLKEQKRVEKEQKELKKQAEIEQRQKEKEAKEESRRKREEAKEEEKKRKEEEKLEAERKKQKAASNFVNFFVAKKPSDTKPTEEEKKFENKENFMPFEVKADMKLAPNVRRVLKDNEKSKLDDLVTISNVNISNLYINEIKSKSYTIRKSSRTWPIEANDDVVILDDDEESSNVVQASNSIIEKHHPKLLMFEDNRRPPYWGTWRKTSKSINPRRPFAKDTEWFDYEVDSDDEWEEEEPGESICGSDDEKDKDEDNAEDNEYDVDNDFMVPHGYLSEEEIVAEDDEEDDDLNPEKQKSKLELLGKQFEAERNAKTLKLKPKVIGCVWLNEKNECPETTPARTVQYLSSRNAWIREIPMKLTAPAEGDSTNNECGTPSNKNSVASSVRKAKALEDAIPDLIRLLHGNTHNKKFLLKEFSEFLQKKMERKNAIPKSKLTEKIKEIAAWSPCPEAGPMHEKMMWYVSETYRTKYLPDEKLPIPNTWKYILTPKKKVNAVETVEKEEKEKEKRTSLITQFTKSVDSPAEKSSPATPVSTSTASSLKLTPTSSRQPKRASLISVSKGEPLPKSPRVSLMDKFVKKDSNSKESDKSKNEDSGDDCKIIDQSD